MAGFASDKNTPTIGVVYADNVDFSGGFPVEAKITTNGQLLIGSTSTPHIRVGSFTSPSGTVDIGYSSPNITLGAGSSVATTFTTNSGSANPSSNILNVLTANATVKFTGSGSTITQDFNLSNIILGSAATSITSGVLNVGLGLDCLRIVTTALQNACLGWGAGYSVTTGNSNTFIGAASGSNVSIGQSNVAIGTGALQGVGHTNTDADQNVALGYFSLNRIDNGDINIAIGYQAGYNYTGSEGHNIVIGHEGVLGESNVMRLGTQGDITQTYIAGVVNTLSGIVVKVTSPGAYPYTTLITDDVILVDTASARTIVPLASPVTGQKFVIKDSVGSAAANNITITPSGKNIDGAASSIINTNYSSRTIVYNGTEWSII